MAFKKATKEKAKLRCAIFGPSGSGKTYSALRMAKGMGGRVAVVDTERGSASKYADRFEFDVCEPDANAIENYVAAMAEAKEYDVLILDSLTHAWQELLSEIDRLANAKYKGNTWSAWSEGTPKQRSLVNAILAFPGHIIATMRSKTEWVTEQSGNGRSRPVRVGLAPEQGKGIEYEFDLLVEISPEHMANVIKDRTGKFQDQVIDKPGEDFGRQLVAWLSEGAAPAEKPVKKPAPANVPDDLLGEEKCNEIIEAFKRFGKTQADLEDRVKRSAKDWAEGDRAEFTKMYGELSAPKKTKENK
jgi:hypothetical protein